MFVWSRFIVFVFDLNNPFEINTHGSGQIEYSYNGICEFYFKTFGFFILTIIKRDLIIPQFFERFTDFGMDQRQLCDYYR